MLRKGLVIATLLRRGHRPVCQRSLRTHFCGIGDLPEEILAQPAFTLASTKTDVDLVVVSAAELGLASIQFASPIL
jgi:hypothetical protein